MRVEIAEQLAVCAMKACAILTKDDAQLSGMYAKVARFGSSLQTLGLIPTAMIFEEDRVNISPNQNKKPGDHLVNDAIFDTLKAFAASEGIKNLWKPDKRLNELMTSFTSLLALYRGLQNPADYSLVKEYSLRACASLKLALNTYPDSEKSKDAKGSEKHDG